MGKEYCVYEHIFPNGKKYIGISCDAEKRWRNGKGYETQGKIANAIKHFGWRNVKHNIIVDGVQKEQAENLECYLIAELDTINNGYNTAIGGQNVNSTYLNEHILFEIITSKKLHEEHEQPQLDIVLRFEEGKYNEKRARIYNWIDEAIERDFPTYKGKHQIDGWETNCEAYWYYAKAIYEQLASLNYDKNAIRSYDDVMWEKILEMSMSWLKGNTETG